MKLKPKKILCVLAVGLFMAAVGYITGCKGKEAREKEAAGVAKTPDIKVKLAQFAPTELYYDKSILNEEQTQVLKKLIQAAEYMNSIFWKQASYIGEDIKAELESSDDPGDKDLLRYLKINYGPFDRLEENKPFIGESVKPAGAAFYPADMTKEEFKEYITALPEAAGEFESPYTVIRRKDGELTAVPYNKEYAEYLEPAAALLREAAEITTNASLKKYLAQRAEDLLSNDYYQSDCDWIDLEGNLVEIVIGPYEVYEDGLMGLKAAYESFVYINDIEEMEKVRGYIDYLGEMQKNLPVEQKYKDQEVAGLKSPLNVVFEAYTAGDTRAGVQTLAFVLPNDERVREEKGSKKVMLKNMMETKFDKVLMPISQVILSPEDVENVSFYAYFNETILHELSHVLGVNYTTLPDGTRTTVKKALKEHYSPIEEGKADIVGIYNVRLLMEKGWIPPEKETEIYTTYLAGMFRSMRFGLHEAHALGTLVQFNFMREKGAFLYDEESEKFRVDISKTKDAVRELAAKFLILEGNGSYENVKAFLAEYGTANPLIKKTIEKLKDIPVDIEPKFK
jgi:hypothetical protein